MQKKEQQFKQQIASVLGTGPDRIHLYWKGRVALFALLRAAGIKPGDEVIIPGFTCVVVPNAIIYAGATPVYADIQRTSLNPSFDDIRAAVTPNTRVIVLQNTFGLSSDLEAITSWAKTTGILTFEDCTHGFGGFYHGKPNGTFCDAAFFSTQWNKPFSTGIGGFAAVFNMTLHDALTETDKLLIQPRWDEDALLRLLIMSRKYLLNSTTYYFLRDLYRLLSRFRLTIGSSTGSELKDPVMPESYFKAMGCTQISEGIRALASLDNRLRVRKMNAALYTQLLSGNGKYHVCRELHEDHAFLKYPVLATDRKKFMEAAKKERIEIGDWFISPIHPVESDFTKWQLNLKDIPVAANISDHVLNIPTDTRHPERVVSFLQKNMDLLY